MHYTLIASATLSQEEEQQFQTALNAHKRVGELVNVCRNGDIVEVHHNNAPFHAREIFRFSVTEGTLKAMGWGGKFTLH